MDAVTYAEYLERLVASLSAGSCPGDYQPAAASAVAPQQGHSMSAPALSRSATQSVQ